MTRLQFACCLLLALASPGFAQHGEAPNGYYPPGYGGDTWTGEVTATNDATREITLMYTKGSKTETFTGVLREGYKVKLKDGTPHDLKPSEIAPGTRIKVFYSQKTKKDADKKVKYYEIFQFELVK